MAFSVLPALLVPSLALTPPAPLLAQAEVALLTTNPSTETLYLAPDTAFPLTLELTEATLVDGIRLPAGAVIRGQFEPVEGGLVYEATGAEVDNRIIEFSAYSALLPDIKDPRETSTGSILGDTAIGAVGGAAVSGILRGGRIGVGEVLGGAAAGAIIGNVSAQRVVVVDPGQTLELQLD